MDKTISGALRPYRGGVTGDSELRDEDLEREIELVGALVLAAGQCEGSLPQEEIDQLLGVGEDDPAQNGSP